MIRAEWNEIQKKYTHHSMTRGEEYELEKLKYRINKAKLKEEEIKATLQNLYALKQALLNETEVKDFDVNRKCC